MQKNICIVCTNLTSINVFLKEIIIQLSKKYNVTIISKYSDEKLLKHKNIKYKFIPIRRKVNFFYDFISLFHLTFYFLFNKCDLCLSLTPKAGLLAAISGFISQINGKFKGFTIAYKTKDKDIKCIIANAKGSKFNDEIIGNDAKNKINGGSGNDSLFGGAGNDKLIGGKGKDIFKLSKGKGYDLIQDFKNKQDKIFIGSMKKLKLKNKGKDVYIYKGKDLLAKVKKAKGLLSKQGKYLV